MAEPKTRSIGFSSGANELLSIYGKSGEYVYKDGQGNPNYNYLYKPVAVGTVNSGAAPTDRKTADILVDASLSYNAGYEKGKSEGGGAGSISIGDILATSYPTGTVARQISNLIASTSEDAVQFKVKCTCGAEKTYYIEVP